MMLKPLPRLLTTVFPLATFLMLGACQDPSSSRAPYRADRVPPAKITGRAEACIPLGQFSETRVRDGRTIDFLRGPGRRGWRNTLPQSCPGLASEQAFSFNTSLSQLCNTDIIRVLQRTGPGLTPGAACGLGEFTPIELSRR